MKRIKMYDVLIGCSPIVHSHLERFIGLRGGGYVCVLFFSVLEYVSPLCLVSAAVCAPSPPAPSSAPPPIPP